MPAHNMGSPELNCVHSVKVLLCYILDKLNRPVTEEQLRTVSEDSGVINYFYFSDALEELIENGSVEVNGTDRVLTLTEKGRLGSDYFNMTIPLVFRRKLLKAAFNFFAAIDRQAGCRCEVDENDRVKFSLTDGAAVLIDMSVYAPDREQAQLIADRINSDPLHAYRSIIGFLLDNKQEEPDIDKFL